MSNIISIDQLRKNKPCFIEAKEGNTYDRKRIVPIRNFLKVCAQMGYSFEEILNIFLKNKELIFDFQDIGKSFTWEEFDTLINDCQYIFAKEELVIERARSSFLIYQLEEILKDSSYVPFKSNFSSTTAKAWFIESLLEDALYHYFPLKTCGGE